MINYISKPFKWFFKLEAASGLVLLISAVLALIISNSNLSSVYFETLNKYLFIGINNFGLKLSVLHWINDALMAIFFFFVTLEIKREFLQGELSNIKQALLPIIAAVGGMVVPALFYVVINFGDPANIHIIGKDILRFHAVYWPAFLLAAGIKPPQRVYGHGWILSGDEKMSKSKGNILDPIEIIDIYGLDALRYYLIKEVSFGNDGNISKEKLESCINSDLANNYGNLCQRVILFCEKNIGLKVPEKI